MENKSKIISDLKAEELQRMRALTPKKRIELEFAHNDFIRCFFGMGLKAKGFSEGEIKQIWRKK